MSEKPSKRERQEQRNPNAERGEGIGSDKLDRSQKRNYSSYSTFIYKVLKQVHPDTGINSYSFSFLMFPFVHIFVFCALYFAHFLGISNKAMGIMNSFVADIFEQLATGILFKIYEAISYHDISSPSSFLQFLP